MVIFKQIDPNSSYLRRFYPFSRMFSKQSHFSAEAGLFTHFHLGTEFGSRILSCIRSPKGLFSRKQK